MSTCRRILMSNVFGCSFHFIDDLAMVRFHSSLCNQSWRAVKCYSYLFKIKEFFSWPDKIVSFVINLLNNKTILADEAVGLVG